MCISRVLPLVALLAGCLPPLDIPTMQSNPDDDYDGDGVTETDGDCDDGDSEIAVVVWYADADKDGHGVDNGSGTVSCESPGEGYVTVGDDCADDDANVHPARQEVCNGIDDNCKDAEQGAADAPTWYGDGDGDAYGDETQPLAACKQPGGYASKGGDCDDDDGERHPGATETCTDTVDLNCDGSSGADDADKDGTIACEDCDDQNPLAHPGQDEVCDGFDDDCDGFVDDDDADVSDVPSWYTDKDRDTYGDGASTPIVQCKQPDIDHAANADDCDDTDDTIHPAASGDECDGKDIDYDCSGEVLSATDLDKDTFSTCVDCDDTDKAVTDTVFADVDDDGFGDPDAAFKDCAQAGAVTKAADCDDADDTSYPGAPEACDDLVDNDCDTRVDEGCKLLEHSGNVTNYQTWTADYTHVVKGTVNVNGGGEVDIEDGTTVLFEPNAVLQVGVYGSAGTLYVDGSTQGVVFDEAQPGQGWGGIVFGDRTDSASQLVGFTLRNAGHGTVASLFIDAGSLHVADCEIADGIKDAVFIEDGGVAAIDNCWIHANDGEGVEMHRNAALERGGALERTFHDNLIEDNTGYPITVPSNFVGELDDSGVYDSKNSKFAYPYVYAGGITTTAAWQDLASPYLMEGGEFRVQGNASPVLTIEPGAVLKFKGGGNLIVGGGQTGTLVIDADSDPVTLTTAATTPAPGGWGGLEVGEQSPRGATSLSGVIVEYAGQAHGSDTAAVSVYRTGITLTNSIVRYSSGSGVYDEYWGNSSVEMSFNQIVDNAGAGIQADGMIGPSASFHDNVVTGNGGAPLTIPGVFLGGMGANNELTGNGIDRVNAVPTFGNTPVNGALTLPALDVPYHFDYSFGVDGAAALLTIEDGAVLEFGTAGNVVIDHGARLVTTDTGGPGVTFTSDRAVPAPGDWGRLYFANTAGSVLDHATIEYGGAGSVSSLFLNFGSLSLTDSLVRSCGGPTAVELNSTPGPTLTVSGTTFANNVGVGLTLGDAPAHLGAGFTGNTFTNNAVPIKTSAATALDILGGNTFIGNTDNRVQLVGGNLYAAGMFHDLGVPWHVIGQINAGYSTVTTVEPGARFEFDTGVGWDFGGTASSFRAIGTSSKPIVFSSAKGALAAPGDWTALTFGGTKEVVLTYVTLEYGGGGAVSGELQCNRQAWGDGALASSITNSTIRYSATMGLYTASGGTACPPFTQSNNTFTDNVGGNTNF